MNWNPNQMIRPFSDIPEDANMATPNIDAVERYVDRVDEYIDSKLKQKHLYKPTLLRLCVVRNVLIKLCSKIDQLIAKFTEFPESEDADLGDSVEVLKENPNNFDSEPVSEIEEDITQPMISMISPADLENMVHKVTHNLSESENPGDAHETHSTVSQKRQIVQAYKSVFEDALNDLPKDQHVLSETIKFLAHWYDVKIVKFQNIRKIDPSANYNIKWIPQYIRDYVVYLGQHIETFDKTISELTQFVDADSTDSRFTRIVPYEVFKLGSACDHNLVTVYASALWYALYSRVFINLTISCCSDCYCSESLVEYAYLNPDQISQVNIDVTPEFIAATRWANS